MASNSSVMSDREQLRSSRRTLLIVLAMFALPVAIASWMYAGSWRPATTGNHGELIQPPRALPELQLASADGKAISVGELKERWSLVYLSSGPCTAACQKNLYYLRQIHTSFAKELDRIQEVLIVLDGTRDGGLGERLRDYPRLKVLSGSANVLASMTATFQGSGGDNAFAERIYIIDPRGFVMMRYPATVDATGIRRDLEKLLKYSWVG